MKQVVEENQTITVQQVQGDVSVVLDGIGTIQATGQNLDGVNPTISITGVPKGEYARIYLIRTHENEHTTLFPKEFIQGTQVEVTSLQYLAQIVDVNKTSSLSKLKLVGSWTKVKEFLQEDLNISFKSTHLSKCPLKRGYGFKIEIEGLPPFLFENLFSLGQCKETFPYRIVKQKRSKKGKKLQNESFYKMKWLEEVKKNDLVSKKNVELSQIITDLKKKVEDLSFDLELQRSAYTLGSSLNDLYL